MHSSSGKLASSDVVLHFFGLISLHLCSVLAPPSGGWHSLNPCSNPVVNYLKKNRQIWSAGRPVKHKHFILGCLHNEDSVCLLKICDGYV